MNTPIADFVRTYAASAPLRMHMPGHKGSVVLGPEMLDITEIDGADVLYQATGVIRESEENAAALFGSRRSFYSAEGSSLCIRAMLYLCEMHAQLQGKRARIAAGRNAHRVFAEAAALLDTEIRWIGQTDSVLRCDIRAAELEALFADADKAPTAVYVTSPDYLGNLAKLPLIAEICHRHGALLLVDNAHGAYLKFLPGGLHPLDSGADLCCDSAHKTLPVLTGGAYLHLAHTCPPQLDAMAERALALFASTSPSYLILQSLDLCNAQIAGTLPQQLAACAAAAGNLCKMLDTEDWQLAGEEPLKLTLCPKSRGFTGAELAAYLVRNGIYPEFSDPDYLVLMLSPQHTERDFEKLCGVLLSCPRRSPILERPPRPAHCEPVLTPREALLKPFVRLPADECLNRILASPSVGCPPAVPICFCGERINEEALALFHYYSIETCDVIA